MGFYRTKNCFFTGKEVISCDETNDDCLDGYYYRVLLNGKIREVRLVWDYDWQNDDWIKENGQSFFDLLDESDNWNFFSHAKDINEIIQFYSALKRK